MIPSGLFLVDNSAKARVGAPEVADRLTRLGLLATCLTVDLEVGYSARDPGSHRTTVERRAVGFTDLPLREEIGERARVVQAALTTRSQHRAAGVVDLLTAAIAEYYQAVVLHYDSDFDHIASVSGQHVRWVVPRGTVH